MVDLQFQDSDTTVAAHWHGFIDLDSGIRWYHWCVGSTPSLNADVCDVVSWRNVGLHTKIRLQLSRKLPGKTNHSRYMFLATNGKIHVNWQWVLMI